jgi:hypothetical protein
MAKYINGTDVPPYPHGIVKAAKAGWQIKAMTLAFFFWPRAWIDGDK